MSIDAAIASFEAAVTRESNKCLGDVTKYLRDVSTKVVTNLIAITPVDTGHAKANWQVGLDVAPVAELTLFEPTPVGVSVGPTLQRAMSVIAGINLNTRTIYIVNNVDYISPIVEDGHSAQVPPGEFSATIQRLESQL